VSPGENSIVSDTTVPNRTDWRVATAIGFVAGLVVGVVTVYAFEQLIGDGLPSHRVEATMFLPLNDNNNRPFSKEKWCEVLGLFAEDFGGATLGPEQEGCWRDDAGQLRREPVRPVIVSFEPGLLTRFRVTLDDAGRRLGQEAVYVRYETPRVELRRVPRDSAKNDR
jgi:hypothetical protein